MKKLHEKISIASPETNDKKTNFDTEIKDFPNPKKHKQISFLKSAVRILGYVIIPLNLENAVILLVASEIIGIIEELV